MDWNAGVDLVDRMEYDNPISFKNGLNIFSLFDLESFISSISVDLYANEFVQLSEVCYLK